MTALLRRTVATSGKRYDGFAEMDCCYFGEEVGRPGPAGSAGPAGALGPTALAPILGWNPSDFLDSRPGHYAQ